MADRLLILWLCLLLALPVSALGHLSQKTRVGGSPEISPNFASGQPSQLVELQQENPDVNNDFVSGVHKYLYVHNNPVNGIEPSGQMAGTFTKSRRP